jgi:type II secretion system protein G
MEKINKGFTLIELLVVIAIVGILSGLIIVSMSSSINAAKDAKIKSDIGTITKAILVYAANTNSYPSGDTYPCTIGGGTTRCTNLEANLAPYLTAIPKTPSNGFYTYSYSGTGPSFILQSTLSTGSIYQYNSSSYFSTASYASTCVSGGGLTCTETIDGAYVVNKFTGTGTTTWQTPVGVTAVQYLVVGGGGGGSAGGNYGGGGGAGQFLTASGFAVSGNLTVTVGAGGASTAAGTGSIFSSITAIGGSAGSVITGGGSGNGYIGGSGSNSIPVGGGGGAGSSGNGNDHHSSARDGSGGDGGIGTYSSITGTSTYYAGGGGGSGAGWPGDHGGTGIAGGGNGCAGSSPGNGYSATANTGSGGGGGDSAGGGGSGGNGGSGVVIIRYLHP